MIDAIRGLSPTHQRQLTRLLDPRADLDDATDEEMLGELVAALRRVLDVPADGDLPDYLRKRLVEVAIGHFQVAENLDLFTDMEVARLLVDFLVDSAQHLAADDERREEFETFLRTKGRGERADWLVQSQRLAAVLRDEAFDRRAARRRAEQVQAEQAAYRETARAILADLSGIAVKGGPTVSSRRGKTLRAVALGGPAGAALAPGLAATASAVAGGLYMAGRGRKDLVKVGATDGAKGRAQRARRSKLVQAVATLCAFLVAAGPEPGS